MRQPLNDKVQVQKFLTNCRRLYRVKQKQWQSEQMQANLASVTSGVEAMTRYAESREGGSPLRATAEAAEHNGAGRAAESTSSIEAFHHIVKENVPQGQSKKWRGAKQSTGGMYSRTLVGELPG